MRPAIGNLLPRKMSGDWRLIAARNSLDDLRQIPGGKILLFPERPQEKGRFGNPQMTQTRDKIVEVFHQTGTALTKERLMAFEKWLAGKSDSEVDARLSRVLSVWVERKLRSAVRRRS